MKSIIIIPARMAATRLPNKPLADINGKPMIVRCMECCMAANIARVVVACDGEQIASVVRAAGGEAVITDPALPSGTDRTFAAYKSLGVEADIVFNVQGDQPHIEAELVTSLVPAIEGADIATPVAFVPDMADFAKPSVVKAIVAQDNRALWFTRGQSPHGEGGYYHHIGIYAYRPKSLEKFVSLPPSPLELREKLEQLRALENGMVIKVAKVNSIPLSIDTHEDLEIARKLVR